MSASAPEPLEGSLFVRKRAQCIFRRPLGESTYLGSAGLWPAAGETLALPGRDDSPPYSLIDMVNNKGLSLDMHQDRELLLQGSLFVLRGTGLGTEDIRICCGP